MNRELEEIESLGVKGGQGRSAGEIADLTWFWFIFACAIGVAVCVCCSSCVRDIPTLVR